MFDFLRKAATFGDLHFTADHHCHLLAGVDDGVQTVGESLQILSDMHAAGVKEVTITPHINPELFPDTTELLVKQKFEELESAIPEKLRTTLNISLGAEYMIVKGWEEREVSQLLQIGQGEVLIEMSYFYQSQNMAESIFHLSMEGLTPVIAHPERYLYMADQLQTLDCWHDMGARYQLNLLSLNGVYGPASIRIMEHLLKHNMYIMAGTDAHSFGHFSDICNMKIPGRYLSQLEFIYKK